MTLPAQTTGFGIKGTAKPRQESGTLLVPITDQEQRLPSQAASRARAGHNGASTHTSRQPGNPQPGSHLGLPGNEESADLLADLEEDEEYYTTTRNHTSARRYHAPPDEYVIQQGNRRFIVHLDAPPIHRQSQQRPRRHSAEEEDYQRSRRGFHPLVFAGFFLFAMIAGYVVLSPLGYAWQALQDDWTYGKTPRTFQTDAVVGHADSPSSPTHFIAENLYGQIIVIEVSRSDPSKARRYNITTVQNNDGNPPVRVEFQDINADGKLDMLVEIGDPGHSFTVTLFNNGTQFVSKL